MFIWEFTKKAERMCLSIISKEKYSIMTEWIKLWEAAAMLLFLHSLESVMAKSLKAEEGSFICPGVSLVGAWLHGSGRCSQWHPCCSQGGQTTLLMQFFSAFSPSPSIFTAPVASTNSDGGGRQQPVRTAHLSLNSFPFFPSRVPAPSLPGC